MPVMPLVRVAGTASAALMNMTAISVVRYALEPAVTSHRATVAAAMSRAMRKGAASHWPPPEVPMVMVSGALFDMADKQPRRLDEEDQDQQREDEGVTVAGVGLRQQPDKQPLGEAENIAAKQRPANRADAADDAGNKRLQPRHGAEQRIDLAELPAPKQAGDGGKRGADGKRGNDRSVDADAHQPSRHQVFR